MFKLMEKHKLMSIVICGLLFIFIIMIIPLILNKIYYAKPICDFVIVGYDINYILEYYGNVLTFVGTVSLGVITVYQNHLSQKKTDEVNQLQLELSKKSMALAEQSYEKQIEETIPKFVIENSSCNGNYMNLTVGIKNVSKIIVSRLKSVSFEVLDSEKNVLLTSDEVVINKTSLVSGEMTAVEFRNKEFGNGQPMMDEWKNVLLVWKFQCDDEYSKVHYYKATSAFGDCTILEFRNKTWNVEKVG